MVVSGVQFQWLAPGVIAGADAPPVIHGPAQYNIAELAVLCRSEAGGFDAVFQWPDVQGGQRQPVTVEVTAGSTHQAAQQRTGTERGAQGQSVNAGTADGAGAKPGGGQVTPADGPGFAGILREQVAVALPFQIPFPALQPPVLVQVFNVCAQGLLP